MSTTAVTIDAGPRAGAGPRTGITCPVAHNCSCVFDPSHRPAAGEATRAALELPAGLKEWTDWGWTYVDRSCDRITLERKRDLGWCANLALSVVTAGLWLIRWIPSLRHPRYDTVTLTVRANGRVVEGARGRRIA